MGGDEDGQDHTSFRSCDVIPSIRSCDVTPSFRSCDVTPSRREDRLELRSDEMGLDRDSVVNNVREAVERSRGRLRPMDDDKVAEFSEIYRRSLAGSAEGLVEKKGRAAKIKKFLAERRKSELNPS